MDLQLDDVTAVVLRADRTLWWPEGRILFAADLHLGKDSTFRAFGLPVPDGTLGADLARLGRACTDTRAEHLVVLGDLVHGRFALDAATVAGFAAWRATHPLPLTLVRGNHDAHVSLLPSEWCVACVDAPFLLGPFACVHDPHDAPVRVPWTLAGHVHGAAYVAGLGKVPAFVVRAGQIILPAFSAFTRGAVTPGVPGERAFACGDATVVEVPQLPLRRRR